MMQARLSSSIERLQAAYDAVVVGSGYGAGIAAYRLAAAGARVCVLERGRELRPGEYPDALHELGRELQVDTPGGHVGRKTGLYDFRINDEVNVFVGCGLGGTSLVNANVSIEPDPRVFEDPVWPEELRADVGTRLERGYRSARTLLGANPLPAKHGRLLKVAAQEKSALAMGRKFALVDINVSFRDGINAAGVAQSECNLCGNCVTGCNGGAKNTVLMNYLPLAQRHGAQLFTEVSVRRVERVDDAWLVHFDLLEAGRERYERPSMFVRAGLVFLGAGTLGSTEILLRSQEAGLRVSRQLGRRFSGNGDVLGFAYNCEPRINGVGFGSETSARQGEVGPCIASVIDDRSPQRPLEAGLILQEGAIPGGLAPLLPEAFGLAALGGKDTDSGLADWLGETARRLRAFFRTHDDDAIAHTQTFLVMSHDDSGGTMALDQDRLRIRWKGAKTQPGILRADEDQLAATKPLGGVYTRNPFWSKLLHQRLTTVHPLGGCVMAASAGAGVVNHKGQVFSGAEGDAVYDTLYVSDGSVVPRSLGVNPLLTICAITERCCELLVADHGGRWNARASDAPALREPAAAEPALREPAAAEPALPEPAAAERDVAEPAARRAPVAARAAAAPRAGVRFTETMVGFFSRGVKEAPRAAATSPRTATAASYSEYWRAYEQGQRQRASLEFVLTISAEDARAFIEDPTHPARMVGTVEAPQLPDGPFTVLGGEFNLFVNDPVDARCKRMHYRMQLADRRGRLRYFEGFKDIRDDRGMDVWRDTTTLFITLYDGPSAQHPVFGQGVLRIRPVDFLRQLQTMQVYGDAEGPLRLRTLMAFARLFLGSLADAYVPLLTDRRSPRRRLAQRLLLAPAVLALVVLWLLPWRPNTLRDEPLITAAAGPTALPSDVAALGIFPQYLRGVDTAHGQYSVENPIWRVQWLRDNVVQTHGGLAEIPVTPKDVRIVQEPAVIKSFVNLAELHAEDDTLIGLGTQVETLTLDSRPPPLGDTVYANTSWTLLLPERGILFLSQKEGGPDIPRRTIEADDSGTPWRGKDEFNHTVGPIPGGSDPKGPRGIVHGGVGGLAGAIGTFREYNSLFEVPPSGTTDIDGATRFELAFLLPAAAARPAAHGQPLPPEVAAWALPPPTLSRLDFSRPFRVMRREFRLRAPLDVVFATHGRAEAGAIIPASLGQREAQVLARTFSALLQLRDRSDTVVGLAGAARCGEDSAWTLTLPGEGTLFVAPDAPARGALHAGAGSILRERRGVIAGGSGHFANVAGTLIESGDLTVGETTLALTYVTN